MANHPAGKLPAPADEAYPTVAAVLEDPEHIAAPGDVVAPIPPGGAVVGPDAASVVQRLAIVAQDIHDGVCTDPMAKARGGARSMIASPGCVPGWMP